MTLLTQHIAIGEQTIECFLNNPLRVGLKAGEHDNNIVKIVIKGIPLSKKNDLISEFLGQQNINLRKPIQNGKSRDKNNTLLNVFSGDRIAYVDKFSKPLPWRERIRDSIALIYHKGQSAETPLKPKLPTVSRKATYENLAQTPLHACSAKNQDTKLVMDALLLKPKTITRL